jgi:3-hydroxybutyryl-CoA dehydratase
VPEVGDTLGPWRLESVSPARARELSVVLQDPNSIHLDPAAVARLGLGTHVINQEPANLAYIINMLDAALPGASLLQVARGRVTLLSNEAGRMLVACDI